MISVKDNAVRIVQREGGYVNDPDDPGGATKFGVTIGTLRRLGLDLTGDNKITKEDVKELTQQDAVDIFLRHYFEKPEIANLPEVLQASVFDMYVNAGSNAVKILQNLLGRFGYKIAADGVIGPNTIKVAQSAAAIAPAHLPDAYGIERRNFYYRLADHRVRSRKFARRKDGGKGGWIVRAEDFISKKYHLTDAQHTKRTEKWV